MFRVKVRVRVRIHITVRVYSEVIVSFMIRVRIRFWVDDILRFRVILRLDILLGLELGFKLY